MWLPELTRHHSISPPCFYRTHSSGICIRKCAGKRMKAIQRSLSARLVLSISPDILCCSVDTSDTALLLQGQGLKSRIHVPFASSVCSIRAWCVIVGISTSLEGKNGFLFLPPPPPLHLFQCPSPCFFSPYINCLLLCSVEILHPLPPISKRDPCFCAALNICFSQ